MGIGVQDYYKTVRREQNKLNLALLAGRLDGQPTEVELLTNDETGEQVKKAKYVYLTSIESNLGTTDTAQTLDGKLIPSVHLMTVAHAARKLADRTHRVSTEEEIEGFIEHQEKQLAFHTLQDARAEMRRKTIVLPAAEMPAVPAGLRRSKAKPDQAE